MSHKLSVCWRTAIRALVITSALAAPCAMADPVETNTDAAARDTDYAAGKHAMEKKDWPEAAKRFQLAAGNLPAALRRTRRSGERCRPIPREASLTDPKGFTYLLTASRAD